MRSSAANVTLKPFLFYIDIAIFSWRSTLCFSGRRFCLCEKRSFVMSVHLCSLHNSTITGQIFMAFYIKVFLKQKIVKTFQCVLKFDKNNKLLREDQRIFFFWCLMLAFFLWLLSLPLPRLLCVPLMLVLSIKYHVESNESVSVSITYNGCTFV
jgi:hypothetical protein